MIFFWLKAVTFLFCLFFVSLRYSYLCLQYSLQAAMLLLTYQIGTLTSLWAYPRYWKISYNIILGGGNLTLATHWHGMRRLTPHGYGRLNLARSNGLARNHQTTTLVLMLWLKKKDLQKFCAVFEGK